MNASPVTSMSKISLDILEQRIAHLEDTFNQRWAAHGDVHKEIDKMRTEAKNTVDERLVVLNNLRAEVIADRSQFLTSEFRDTMDSRLGNINDDISKLEKDSVSQTAYENRQDEMVKRLSILERSMVTADTLNEKEKAIEIRVRSTERLLYMLMGGLMVMQILLKFIRI